MGDMIKHSLYILYPHRSNAMAELRVQAQWQSPLLTDAMLSFFERDGVRKDPNADTTPRIIEEATATNNVVFLPQALMEKTYGGILQVGFFSFFFFFFSFSFFSFYFFICSFSFFPPFFFCFC